MKKIILVFAAIAIAAGAYAQADSINRRMSPRDMNNNQNQNEQYNPADQFQPDGVLMENGKIMVVKNGQRTTLDRDITMSNGTKVKRDGNYTKKDGTTTMLREGEHMDMSGNMISSKTNRDRNRDFNQNMQDKSVNQYYSDGVLMQNGKLMKVKNGQMTTLDRDMTMSNGTKVMTDGNCIKKDGTTTMLKEGEHMDMSGNTISVKTNKDRNMYLVPDSIKNRDF